MVKEYTQVDEDWAIQVVQNMDRVYKDYGPGELFQEWKNDLNKAVVILKARKFNKDVIKIGEELLKYPVVELHKVSR